MQKALSPLQPGHSRGSGRRSGPAASPGYRDLEQADRHPLGEFWFRVQIRCGQRSRRRALCAAQNRGRRALSCAPTAASRRTQGTLPYRHMYRPACRPDVPGPQPGQAGNRTLNLKIARRMNTNKTATTPPAEVPRTVHVTETGRSHFHGDGQRPDLAGPAARHVMGVQVASRGRLPYYRRAAGPA